MEIIRANAFAGTIIENIQFNDGLKYIEPSAFHYQTFFYSKKSSTVSFFVKVFTILSISKSRNRRF